MNNNPKSVNDLDPKLRETYERVMGTQAPNIQKPIMQSTSMPQQSSVQAPIDPPPQPVQSQHVISQTANNPFIANPPTPVQVFSQTAMAPASKTTQPQKKKTNHILPILLVFIGIVLVVVYTVVWLFVFGVVKLP
jgi:hypothetical protein